MIRYSLACDAEHHFDAWFRDSLAYDDLSREGHVACPACGSAAVRKTLMAPAIRRAGKRPPGTEARPTSAEPVGEPSVPVALDAQAPVEDDKSRQMRALLREFHAKIKASSENVGASFPIEARKIHDGDEAPRAIYGTATRDEVRSLVEDGIGILPLPPLPDERN